MGVLVRNISEAEDITSFRVPTRTDGTYFRFEMIADGGWSRYYDDDPAALVGFLIPGYGDLTAARRLASRIRHAVDLQVRLQARLNVFFAETPRTPDENAVLMAARTTQPAITEWECQVPLVLVDAYYSPFSDVPRPVSPSPDDPGSIPTLWWLRPVESDLEYLQSLHEASLIDLNVNTDEVP